MVIGRYTKSSYILGKGKMAWAIRSQQNRALLSEDWGLALCPSPGNVVSADASSLCWWIHSLTCAPWRDCGQELVKAGMAVGKIPQTKDTSFIPSVATRHVPQLLETPGRGNPSVLL